MSIHDLLTIYEDPLILPPPKQITNPITAIFDMDDVLWPFIDHAFEQTKYSISMMSTFVIKDNDCFNDEDKDFIMNKLLRNPEVFKNIQFYPAVDKLEKLVKVGLRVGINTKSLSQAIADQKIPQLKSKFPYLRPDDIIVSVDYKDHAKSGKNIGEEVTFFIDDNPHNIVKSHAQINLLPATTWNTSPSEFYRMRNKNFYVMKDLDTIIESIYQTVQFWRRSGLC